MFACSSPRLYRDLLLGRSGNVSIIFALSALPIVLATGAAIDYTRLTTTRSSLQQAADATVLAVVQDVAKSVTTDAMSRDATRYFAGAMNDPSATIVSGPTLSNDHTQVCLTASTTVNTMFMPAATGGGLSATQSSKVSATSCAKTNNTYEIAMVLDTSGSMNEATGSTTKINSLQSAATQLVNIMNPSASSPRATFSIVPFSLAVNVGASYRGASWLDNAGQSSLAWQNYLQPQNLPAGSFLPASRFALFDAMGVSWGGCVEERPGSYLYSDAAATTGDSLFEPYLYPDEASTSNNDSLMNNYHFTAVNNYLTNNRGGSCTSNDLYTQADNGTKPASNNPGNTSLPRSDTQTMLCKYNSKTNQRSLSYMNAAGMSTGPNLLCDARALTTLTNNNSTLTSAIDGLAAKGSTNLFTGVMWGWRTLSPNGPFNTQVTPNGTTGPQNAKSYGALTNVKVLILMTDGYNSWMSMPSGYGRNQSSYSPMGYYENARLGATTSTNVRAVMDSATLQACTNAKAAGVQIYTVGFSIPSDPIDAQGLSLLKQCASQDTMSYVAQDGTSLINTFKAIAAAMTGVRLVN